MTIWMNLLQFYKQNIFNKQAIIAIINCNNQQYTFQTFRMAQTEILSQLKFRVANLQSNLSQKQKIIDEYKFVQFEADSKIKGMQKIHSQKIKSLLNSIQVLKKEKASIQGLSKQHKRSKLIQQLNKQINDQDLVIEILRKHVYQAEGKQKGRNVCDQIIVKALNKGPERIRPLTREELRMQIQKFKDQNMNLQKKLKQNDKKANQTRANFDDSMSMVSSASENEQILGQNKSQELLNRMRSLQIQVQNLKVESNSKNKIIQKLKGSVSQGQKQKSQIELLKNQIQISNRKVSSYQKMLRQSKQRTNKKLIDLYQRELKVQQLEMIGQQKSERLKSLNQTHNIFIQQLQAQNQSLQASYEQLKQQNQRIILQNISSKKHQQSQKQKIDQIRTINQKKNQELKLNVRQIQKQLQRVFQEKEGLQRRCVQMEAKIFAERGRWIEEKKQLSDQLQELRANKLQAQKVTNLQVQLDTLRQQNRKLQQIFSTGQGSSSDKLLLQRLQNYRRKVQYYQNIINKGEKGKQVQIYNQLFEKYNRLCDQFMEYRNGLGLKKKIKLRKQVLDMNITQKEEYDALSSDIDHLHLDDVDSEILDNFNSSYDYSIHVAEGDQKTRVPKISEADKQLLKLINSDLWCFVKDDKLTKKIQQASHLDQSRDDEQENVYTSEQMRKLRNLSHPQGKKIKVYQQELKKLDDVSDSVSVTSAMQKQIEKYDTDVNIQIDKINRDAPCNINFNKLADVSLQIGSDVQVSSVESGQSNLKRKKKVIAQKASKIKFGSKVSKNSSQMNSQFDQDYLNSDVSSINISQRQLGRIDSDVQTDFRKKKKS